MTVGCNRIKEKISKLAIIEGNGRTQSDQEENCRQPATGCSDSVELMPGIVHSLRSTGRVFW